MANANKVTIDISCEGNTADIASYIKESLKVSGFCKAVSGADSKFGMISDTVPLAGGGIKMTIVMEELAKPEAAPNPA